MSGTIKQSNEQRYYDALRRIARDYIKASQYKDGPFGLDRHEALEYGYENIQSEAAAAIYGKRRPKS